MKKLVFIVTVLTLLVSIDASAQRTQGGQKPKSTVTAPAKGNAGKTGTTKANSATSRKTQSAAQKADRSAIDSRVAKVFENVGVDEYESQRERWEAERNAERERIIGELVSNMVVVLDGPDGTFSMGATSEQGKNAESDERPIHKVKLSGYKIGRYEVTQREWRAVMDDNPSVHTGDNLPVHYVSWDDCQEFIAKLNEITGLRFRLPTEAEWEYAARGGRKSQGYMYAGSNTSDQVAWTSQNSLSKPHPVGVLQANELGLYDMSGNVWEWCADWYAGYNDQTLVNPHGPNSGETRVFRGGGWGFEPRGARVSYRMNGVTGGRYDFTGLRLAMDYQQPVKPGFKPSPKPSLE